MFNLNNKTALVTGATSGIGREIAKALHSMGAKVVISGTNLSSLEELTNELQERVYSIPCNLADPLQTSNLFSEAEKICDKIDILVCNAGITRDNIILRMSDEEFDEVININLRSAFILNRAALKSMVKRKHGRIINISSVVAKSGNFGQANYAASKGGLISMTKSIALEVASRNITVNCIAPGFIKTRMTDAIKEDLKLEIQKRIPLNALGEPKDVAAAAVFLASDEARYITGAVLDVNGGMYL